MQQSMVVTERRPMRPVSSRVRLLLLPVAIAGAIVAALLAFGGSGGDVVTVSSNGDPTESHWVVPVSDLPVADGEFSLEDLDAGASAAGPLHQLIRGRGIDATGTEVLVSGYWWRVSESDDWTSSGVLTQPIEPSGITHILREIPSVHKITDPDDLELIWIIDWANESWPTAYVLEYDATDGGRLSIDIRATNGGTILEDAAEQPNVTVTRLTSG